MHHGIGFVTTLLLSPSIIGGKQGKSIAFLSTRLGDAIMRSLVLRLIGALSVLSTWLTYAAAFFLILLMAINVIDIIGSKWFYWTLPGTLDFSEELMVFLTLLPIAFVQLYRGHINITFVQDCLSPKRQYVMRVVQYVISIMVMGFWTWRSFIQFQAILIDREMKYGIDFPLWPANLAVVLSFAVLTLVLLLFLIKTILSKSEEIA